MITEIPRDDNTKGFLIDLDLATYITESSSSNDPQNGPTASYCTGTPEFMVIEILENYTNLHSYRHDLESFFYVFFGYKPDLPLGLKDWTDRDFRKAATGKYKQMNDDKTFDLMIIKEFRPKMKRLEDLAKETKRVLFFGGGTFSKETDYNIAPALLYGEILAAFQKAIAKESPKPGTGKEKK
ncbi:hypothetical protein RUND412_006591 [Rhizina undulata]